MDFFRIFGRKRKRDEEQDSSGQEPDAAGKPKHPKENCGLFILNSVEDPDIDIVAVHGLGGDWEGTWTHRDTNKLWLRDFFPETCPKARVWSYGYDSATAFSIGVTDIEQVATILLDRVRGECESNREADKPIIFISHSLGGIVVKKALIIAHERREVYGRLLDRVRGVVFFAVPHRGSNAADLATIAANICKFATLGITTNTNFVTALQKNSKEIADISKQFIERSKGLHIRTFYETQKTGSVLIVDDDSARLNIADEIPAPIPGADHISICKFRDSESQNYKQVLGALRMLVKEVTDGID